MNNITLREYYAGQMLQGLYANKELLVIMTNDAEKQGVEPADLIAKRCFEMAEAMTRYNAYPNRSKVK